MDQAIGRHKLAKPYFLRLIKARERSSSIIFGTRQELEQYAEESNSTSYYLMLKIVGVEDMNADHAISHLGKAQGICNMLRALSLEGVKSRGLSAMPVIPQEILLNYGVSYERVLRHTRDDVPVQNCIFDVASLANSHLEKARKLSEKIPSAAKTILLPSIAIERFLERLRLANFYLSDASLLKRDAMLPLAYYWNYLKKAY